jgi:hypothetical protein
MTKELQHRRGTSAEHAVFKGAPGEITVDTNKFVAVVHDNQTLGGHELVGVAATQTVRNKTVIAGSSSTTGTASQPLQVVGGAYVSGNLGVGSTNPVSKLDVAGEISAKRVNTSQEGGQINFARAVDDVLAYSIDCYNDVGLGLTPRLRFIDNVAGAERMSVDRTGNLLIATGSATGTASQPLQVGSGAYIAGNLGVGATNPTYKVSVVGDINFTGSLYQNGTLFTSGGGSSQWVTTSVGINTLSNVGVGTTNPTSKLTVTGDGRFTGIVTAANFNSSSDINLKENIHTVENSLETIQSLRGVSFDWKESGKKSYGVIAQELEEILPELVSSGEIKTVNYNGIIGVLIEAVKELKKEIEDLKNSK